MNRFRRAKDLLSVSRSHLDEANWLLRQNNETLFSLITRWRKSGKIDSSNRLLERYGNRTKYANWHIDQSKELNNRAERLIHGG